jgi:hypothetical protein
MHPSLAESGLAAGTHLAGVVDPVGDEKEKHSAHSGGKPRTFTVDDVPSAKGFENPGKE